MHPLIVLMLELPSPNVPSWSESFCLRSYSRRPSSSKSTLRITLFLLLLPLPPNLLYPFFDIMPKGMDSGNSNKTRTQVSIDKKQDTLRLLGVLLNESFVTADIETLVVSAGIKLCYDSSQPNHELPKTFWKRLGCKLKWKAFFRSLWPSRT